VERFDFDDYNWQRRPFRMYPAYGQSKLGNVLFNRALAGRLAGTQVTTHAFHPGVVGTHLGINNGLIARGINLALRPFARKPSEGAATALYLATDPSVQKENGTYFKDSRPARPHASGRDDVAAERLLTLSESLLEERGV
jgi:NAD(P)-dependent dehydrogenase (short-subunit alcohol dehydrogenase family)